MATILLEDLLKQSTIDLTKVHNIYVTPNRLSPFFNEWKDVNAFSVDAGNKAIKFLFSGQDGTVSSHDANGHEHYVAVKNTDDSVSVLYGLSSDYIDALSNPWTFKVIEGTDEGAALFAGFKAFLDSNYDGLFSGDSITVEVDSDVAPTTTTTSTSTSTTTTSTTLNP